MGEDVLKGNIVLDIDRAGLKADLVFTPDVTGPAWTEEGIFELLAENAVIEGVHSEAVRRLFGSSPDTGSEVIRFSVAEGKPPELPTAAVFEWNEMPIPEGLEKDVKKVLLTSPNPEVVRKTTKKVKVRKKDIQKPALPFSKGRERMIEAVETREIREPVNVNPETIASGWVEGGGKLADIIPPVPGKPGKTVFGKPIAPEAPGDEFFLGRGIIKKEKQLVAQYSGVFRRGGNWAEIIPFQGHEWNLSFSPDNVTCFLDFTPGGADASMPEPAEILKEAEALGVDLSLCIMEKELSKELREAVRNDRPIEKLPLHIDGDAYFSIDVPDDKMSATLVMVKGRGKGKPLVLKEIGRAIKVSGIKNLDYEKIKHDILEFYRSKDHELRGYLLAEGTPPEGQDRTEVKSEVAFLKDEEMKEIRDRLESLSGDNSNSLPSFDEFPPSRVNEMAMVREDQAVAILSVPKGKDGTDIYGNSVTPGSGKSPGYFLYEKVKLSDNSVVSEINGILDWAETPEGIMMRCRPHKDAEISVEVSPDAMAAYISLYPPVGTGRPLSLEAVQTAVKEKEITNGVDVEKINEAFEAAAAGDPVKGFQIATGMPPTHQGESRLTFEIELASDRGVSIRKDGRADYKNQDRITGVQEGTKIARILSPDIQPRDGVDVFGNPVKAQEAPPLNLQIGDQIRQERGNNGTITLYAGKSGELLYDEKRIDIRQVHTVQGNVGPKTGNIKFSGAVEVTGSLLPGFAVFSGADVLIGENVEAGLVSSDSSIRINQGVKGGGKAVLRAKKEISASFLEEAMVLAVGDVEVKNSCLRCSIKTNGKLILSSDKGDLVGGVIRVRKGLEAVNIGTEKGIKTQISFGQDYLIADRIELEEKEIQKLKENIAKIDSSLRQYEKVGDRLRLDSARKEKLIYLKMIEKRSIRLFNYREKFEEHLPSTIFARGTVYPGVIFESHGRYKEITAPQKGVKISFDPKLGHISVVPVNEQKE